LDGEKRRNFHQFVLSTYRATGRLPSKGERAEEDQSEKKKRRAFQIVAN